METNSIKSIAGGGVVCSGREAVSVFQCTTLASALRLYARSGIKANRSYTPGNMMAMAELLLGKKLPKKAYHQAADELTALARAKGALIKAAS